MTSDQGQHRMAAAILLGLLGGFTPGDFRTPSRAINLGGETPLALGWTPTPIPAPAKAKKELSPEEQAVRAWLQTAGNGVVYLGTTTVAYSIAGNFVNVALAHLGRNDQFSRPAGRALAIQRLKSGASVLLSMPQDVASKTTSIHNWLQDVFQSQFDVK